jgi:hypothetical protein
MLNYIGGGDGIYMNYRFAQPTRTSRQHIARWDPEFQFPFADVTFRDPVTHLTGGRLARCEAFTERFDTSDLMGARALLDEP